MASNQQKRILLNHQVQSQQLKQNLLDNGRYDINILIGIYILNHLSIW